MEGKKYWYGKEVEGRLYGLDTLCIAADFKKFKKVAKRFNHILIGTSLIDEMHKNDTTITWGLLERMIDDESKFVSIEVRPKQLDKIPHKMKLKCHILYWIDAPEIAQLKDSDSVKICTQDHEMRVFTLFNGQKVKRDDYYHDRYDR